MIHFLIFISCGCFAFYGALAVFSENMVAEFERYGLAKYRVLVGVCELLGALGLGVGLVFHPVLILASLGLGVLMVLGVFTRVRIRDPFLLVLPAFSLMIINFVIFFWAL